MFVTQTTTLLVHPRPAVATLLGRVTALPRWCGGLRRAHRPGGVIAPCGPAGCELRYVVTRDVHLLLLARTISRPIAEEPDAPIVHVARGDGVTLTWAFTLVDEPGPTGGAHTRLLARTELDVDAEHPTAAHRVAISRLIARRAPEDLTRLAALLERQRAPLRAALTSAVAPPSAAPRPPTPPTPPTHA
jgi:hypothetical protein